jgi:PAS domain S-box-containing protein
MPFSSHGLAAPFPFLAPGCCGGHPINLQNNKLNIATRSLPKTVGTPETAPTGRPFARIRRTLAILYLLLLAILVVSAYLIIHNTQENALGAARQNNQMLARVLEEHAARTFGEVDKVIQGAAEQFAERGGVAKSGERAVHLLLKGRKDRLPQAASLGAVLPDGKMFARAAEYPAQPGNVSDRDDFIYLRDHDGDVPYIGSPAKNPFGPGHLIHISRRITLPDGRFGGIVRGAVATEYLVRFYADLQLPPDTVIALVKPDGNPIFRHPFVDNLKQFNVAATAAFKDGRPASRMGIFTRLSPDGGREHLVAYRWFADESLGVFVGTPTDGALAASGSYARRVFASGLLIAVVIGALLRLIFHNLLREETLSKERRAAEQALHASESRLREAQRIAHVGNWELDLAGNSLYWSDEIFRIFEIDQQKFGATYEAFLATIHPSDREKVNAAYRESVERRIPYEIRHRLLFPDGRIKHVRESGESQYAEDGTPLRSIGTVQDITGQVLAEQEIRALNDSLERRVATRTEELAQANRELESFSYSVSHDLRAPLRAINGFSRILQDSEEFSLSAESRDLLDRIVRNTNRMGDLIDDILDYSRASQTALNRKEVDLTQLARAACDEHAPSYPDATVRIGQLGAAWGDPAMLRQVFDNLVANAFKYSGKRDDAQIEIGVQEASDGKVYFVRDNGAGFDMQFAGKLFGMFQRMHTDKDFPGTGVGLAIVKRIVERHGGRIWAEAAVGAGATFRFTLPRNEQPRPEV